MSSLTSPLRCLNTYGIPSVLEEVDNNYRRWEIFYERLVRFGLLSYFSPRVYVFFFLSFFPSIDPLQIQSVTLIILKNGIDT